MRDHAISTGLLAITSAANNTVTTVKASLVINSPDSSDLFSPQK